MKFTKAHVNGNDFVIVFQRPERLDDAVVRAIADRRCGVGCDQVMFVDTDARAASGVTGSICDITIFNSDGTTAKMCGNGVCAIASCVACRSGHKGIDITARVCEAEYSIRVCDPDVTAEFPLPTLLDGGIFSTGNRHVIREMGDVSEVDSISENHRECNIHFVDAVNDTKIRMKTFERGVGWTDACGSGAVASVFRLGLTGRVEVMHDGGSSLVEITSDHAYLTVRPRITFEGVWCEQSIT
jgi:diaminopimelate epimerase